MSDIKTDEESSKEMEEDNLKQMELLAEFSWSRASRLNSPESWKDASLELHSYTDALIRFNIGAYLTCRESFDFLRDVAYVKSLLIKNNGV